MHLLLFLLPEYTSSVTNHQQANIFLWSFLIISGIVLACIPTPLPAQTLTQTPLHPPFHLVPTIQIIFILMSHLKTCQYPLTCSPLCPLFPLVLTMQINIHQQTQLIARVHYPTFHTMCMESMEIQLVLNQSATLLLISQWVLSKMALAQTEMLNSSVMNIIYHPTW